MARNRVIYQSAGLFVAPNATGTQFTVGGNTGVTAITQLTRVQSISQGYNIPRTDLNQFGELAAIDRIILESPTVNLSFDWLVNSLYNERQLGMTISTGSYVSAISGILTKVSDEKNYYVKVVGEGKDLLGEAVTANSAQVMGIGNGFITSYSTEGAVGDFPRTSVSVEALNVKFDSVTGAGVPAINPENGTAITQFIYDLPVGLSSPAGLNISALRPGDITVDMGAYNDPGVDIADWKIQSYSLGFDLTREPLQKLGSKYAFSREITFPVTVNLSFTANVGDLKSGNLTNVIAADSNYNIAININKPAGGQAVQYLLRQCKSDGQDQSLDIGSSQSVTLNFSAQIGGSAQTGIGMFISGLN